jgi:hypothetical protein
VCHRNDRLTAGGGTAILIRRGIDHHAVPIQGLEHLPGGHCLPVKDGQLTSENPGGLPVTLLAPA